MTCDDDQLDVFFYVLGDRPLHGSQGNTKINIDSLLSRYNDENCGCNSFIRL